MRKRWKQESRAWLGPGDYLAAGISLEEAPLSVHGEGANCSREARSSERRAAATLSPFVGRVSAEQIALYRQITSTLAVESVSCTMSSRGQCAAIQSPEKFNPVAKEAPPKPTARLVSYSRRKYGYEGAEP